MRARAHILVLLKGLCTSFVTGYDDTDSSKIAFFAKEHEEEHVTAELYMYLHYILIVCSFLTLSVI